MGQTIQIVEWGQSISAEYDFEYDDIPRPEKTLRLLTGGKGPEPISAWSTTPKTRRTNT
ncbi:MAG: hypothetical protein IPJ00_11020 [Saprospirales bacterium]|nr:hypothetical protein [Saprospirales bacterium]